MERIKNRLKEELDRITSQKEKAKRFPDVRRLFQILIQLAENIPYDSIQTYPRPDHPDPEKRGDPF